MLKKIQSFLFKNSTLYQTIAKNTFWLFSGQFVGRLLRAGLVIYAARILGAASWGAFSYALSLAAFLTIFSDFGINALITKEASRNPELRQKYLATAFSIKLVLLAGLVVLISFIHPFLSKIKEANSLLPIIIFVFAFDSLRDLGASLARSLEKMEIEAGLNIFTNLAIVILGFVFLFASPSSYFLAMAYALGSGLGLLGVFVVLGKYFANLLKNVSGSLVKPILLSAWPFGLLGFMGAVMINTDIMMLGWMRSAPEVGFYSAAQKPIQLLYILPTFLASSIFPALSRFAKDQKEKFRDIFGNSLKITLAVALALAVGGLLLASWIINLLYGVEYLPSINSLKILSLTLPIVFPSMIIGNAIFAYDKQKHLIVYVLMGIFGNVFFNLLFIPVWGIEGAAWSTVINQLIINTYVWLKMRKIQGSA